MHFRNKAIAASVAIIYLSSVAATESAAATCTSVLARTTLIAHSRLLVETLPSQANPNAGNPPGARAPTQTSATGHVRQANSEF